VVGEERGFISAPRDTGARGAELDRLIARQRDYFARRGEAVEWKTYDYDEPADLPARLRAPGFAPEDTETVVVALTADVAVEPVLPHGVVLRQVTADADMRRISAMESKVWDEDQSRTDDHLIRELAATPDDLIVLTAEAGPQVIAAGWLRFQPGTQFAGLWGGATLSEWRGRGIYRALVARRGQLAAARASATSRWTPPATARRSSAAWASSPSPPPPPTSGPRSPVPPIAGLRGRAPRASLAERTYGEAARRAASMVTR
jgi:hypothetical protein